MTQATQQRFSVLGPMKATRVRYEEQWGRRCLESPYTISIFERLALANKHILMPCRAKFTAVEKTDVV
jgi:hypothetical protein